MSGRMTRRQVFPFVTIVAPVPTTQFASNAITLTAVDATNYNRSYSILRWGPGLNLGRIEIAFDGASNSASRASADSGSHIYVGLATSAIPEPGSASVVGALLLSFGLIRYRKSNS